MSPFSVVEGMFPFSAVGGMSPKNHISQCDFLYAIFLYCQKNNLHLTNNNSMESILQSISISQLISIFIKISLKNT